jgi:N-acetylmuramoyl-L-alanine amidase
MKKFYLLLYFYFFLYPIFSQTTIESFRVSFHSNKARLVWDISRFGSIQVTQLKFPHKLIINFQSFQLKNPILFPQHPWFEKTEIIIKENNSIQFIFTLKKELSHNAFFLKPTRHLGSRFVLDLKDKDSPAFLYTRSILIVIDPGHGGKDPGAIGPNGIKEKDVCLKIAKRLARRINKNPNMKAVLSREKDEFISLEDRVTLASKLKTDLFISIHADSSQNLQAMGSSVFVLSEKGWYEEVKKIEINSKLNLTGISQENFWTSVALDFKSDKSQKAAEIILNKLAQVTNPSHQKVKGSEFTVLRNLQIPALLIETDFISNPDREKLLNTKKYQKKIAKAIYLGLLEYFEKSS